MAGLRARLRSGRFAGHVDRFDAAEVVGWLRRRGSDAPLAIDVFADGVCLAEGLIADERRDDLAAAGYGTGCHGFTVDLRSRGLGAAREVTVHLARHARPVLRAERSENAGRYLCVIETLSVDALSGWAVDRADPEAAVPLDLSICGLPYGPLSANAWRADLAEAGVSRGRGGFRLPWRLHGLDAGIWEVTLRLPDGSTAGGDLIHDGTDDGVPPPCPRDALQPRCDKDPQGALTVVIPVHNAPSDLATCLQRVRMYTPPHVRIVVIDDASPDPEVARVLDAAAGEQPVEVLRNATNLGYTRTANRGLAFAGQSDVILLNSDARVGPGWIEGLRRAATSRPRVATVTPLSDNAGAFAAPEMGRATILPYGVSEAELALAVRRRALGLYPEVPTGSGFCMYLRRAALDALGGFDAMAFPVGYGEENDFCMRAVRAGWHNLVDDRTIVFHARSASFGAKRAELAQRGREIVGARYPEYGKAIEVLERGPELCSARFAVRQAIADCVMPGAGRTRVLFVVSSKGGGTPATNLDLMRAMDDAVEGWLLFSDGETLELGEMVDGEVQPRRCHRLRRPVSAILHGSDEYDAVVSEWLFRLAPSVVHLRHMARHGLSLPALAKSSGAAVVHSLHDYYSLCPTVKLIDGDGVFCGGACRPGFRDCRPELWPKDSLPPLRDGWVHEWRARMGAALAPCDAFVVTSPNVRDRITAHLPAVADRRVEVIPHGRDFDAMCDVRAVRRPDEPLRLLMPGSLDAAKGLEVIRRLAKVARGRLEIHVLGEVDPREAPLPATVVVHGGYARSDFARLAREIRPHLGAVFSIWEETWAHVLTELWSVGLPAVVFDYPTVTRRVRETGAGWAVDRRMREDPEALDATLAKIARDSDGIKERAAAVTAWQRGKGRSMSCAAMAADYLDLYRSLLVHKSRRVGTGTGKSCDSRRPLPVSHEAPRTRTRPRVAVVCPAEADLRRANASTHIRVWERCRNHVARPLTYVRMTPDGALASLREGTVHAVMVQRTALPNDLVAPVQEAAATREIPIVVDLDDDLLAVPTDKDPVGHYAGAKAGLHGLLSGAACVTVSTQTLAHRLEREMPGLRGRLMVRENRLSDRLWRAAPPERKPDGFVRALFMGTPTHDEDLALVLDAAGQVAAQDARFRLALVGVTGRSGTPGTGDDGVPDWIERWEIPDQARDYPAFVPWLRRRVATVDFGLAPLAPTDFNASKSGLKMLDYGGLGLPVLASDASAYAELGRIAPGVTLVRDRDDKPSDAWRRALTARIERERDLRHDGARLRAWVCAEAFLGQTLAAHDAWLCSLIQRQG